MGQLSRRIPADSSSHIFSKYSEMRGLLSCGPRRLDHRRGGSCAEHLSRELYEYDPEGMGSSVGAPDDEYDDGAIALIRCLQDRSPAASVGETVRRLLA